jgi:hypothetical protein
MTLTALLLGLSISQASDDDTILFSYIISRAGASNGLGGKDLFQTQWVPGELSSMGRR